MKEIATYPDDLFLVSYPRSGNTWMRYLLANLLQPDFSWHLGNIHIVVPDIYMMDVSTVPRPRIIKSHEPFSDTYPKVIYMYRDGRDVAVSYYNLSKTAFGYTGSFDDFLLAMLQGGDAVVYGAWQNHVESWLNAAKMRDVYLVQYEALCTNTSGVMAKLCSCLGIDVTVNQLSLAIQKSDFAERRNDVEKYSPYYSTGFRGGVKGGPGKWREVFTVEMNELFWDYTGELMSKLGYSKS